MVLMIFGITGLDVMREFVVDSSFNFFIIVYFVLFGCMLGGGSINRIVGFSYEVFFGLLLWLVGVDVIVFSFFGGRFGFSVDECKVINVGCMWVMGDLFVILFFLGGGMMFECIV